MSAPQSHMQPCDIGKLPSWHFDLNAILERYHAVNESIWNAFVGKSRECFTLQCELDSARAELEQSRRWVQYYMSEAERIKRDYGFYRKT